MALINGNNLNNVLLGTVFNDTINGFGGTDLLQGFNGNDFLNGGTGADVMFGGLGNDTYVVDNFGDFVFENAGAGIDRIISFISLSLNVPAKAAVENLSLFGAAANGAGNALGNVISGNNFNNILSGLDGNDFLFGLGGIDRLFGGRGNDLLDGGLGGDLLNGGGLGSDAFRFSTALTSFDVIQDFSHLALLNSDVIQLDDDVFIGVGPFNNPLAPAAFSDGPATTTAQRIIYIESTGGIYYDRDGSGLLARPIHFATLSNHPTDVDNTDFFVIA